MDGSTPRPWKHIPWHIAEGPSEVRSPFGWAICFISHSDDDARRIVAAVNATSDLPIEALEADVVRKLVEALEAADRHFGPFAEITINGQSDPDDVRTVGMIRAALTLAKGEAA